MTKGNIIDLIMYRNQRNAIPEKNVTPVSEELKDAIQSLIKELRDPGAIQIPRQVKS